MTDVLRLVGKHRANGLLVDTNLLLLYLVGKINPQRISNFKRTSQYTIEDFDLLAYLMEQFKTLFITPHVLTEVSNLGDLPGKERWTFRSSLARMIEQANEHFAESRVVISDELDVFNRLGLTGAAIVAFSRRPCLLVTDDLDLWDTLARRGVDAINFNHLRPLNWS